VEFAATVSHARKFLSPSSPAQVQAQIAAWRESPTLHILSDSAESLEHWLELILNRQVQGPHHHDARIVAVCLSHGIKELWTADRDYLRYPELLTRNPLVG
jgi:predicted nucleic acid-binding protein